MLRKSIKKSNNEVMHNQVIRTLHSNTKITPHTLMELSVTQWNRLKANTILLSGITIDNTIKKYPIVQYTTIIHGKHIKSNVIKRKEMNSAGNRIFWNKVNLDRIFGGYFLIAAMKKRNAKTLQ